MFSQCHLQTLLIHTTYCLQNIPSPSGTIIDLLWLHWGYPLLLIFSTAIHAGMAVVSILYFLAGQLPSNETLRLHGTHASDFDR